ncbi:hypothetical protein HJG60_008005 [Phyllostomus discolor]|uniref:Craniofacial development protein 2-like n=1 Tax=Phyllostomus discolor TaxID=89673 RepID=A0A834EVF2_9CHIR|nr:hypothetical protein HJG60_008005 [Phyllostomus discolor]
MQMERKKSWCSSTYVQQKDTFNPRLSIVRGKQGHYIMIKGTIQQEDITLVNIYAPITGALEYIKQILMDIKQEITRNIIIVGDFITSLTSMDRSSKQNKQGGSGLKDILHQMDLTDIFKAFHAKAVDYTYFSITHGMFCRIDYMLEYKTRLKNLR